MTFGNLRQIEANRSQWKRISRREAIEWCRRNRVVVVHREKGVDVVSVFSPQSRFFSGNGPYPYSTYQYFLDLGARQKDFVHNAAAGEKTAKPFDPFDASQYTPLDEVEPAKLYPIVFELAGSNGKPFPPTAYELTLPDGSKRTGTSGADGFIRHEFNRQPGQAKLKLLPELANDELPSEPNPNPEPEPPKPEPKPTGENPKPEEPKPENPGAPKDEPEPTEPGYRPGYTGTEDKATSPALLDFKKTDTLIKDLSEDEFRKAFVDVAKVMDDLGLNRNDGEDRAQAYLDMVTWDPVTRKGWTNDNTINTSSCGMFVRNIWWLCGARGTTLFDAPYKSGVLTDLLRFDTQASRQWGSEFTAKTFLPKPGDVIYLYNPPNNAQHIFIIGSLDKKIVDENGVATVYNDDGSLASEITFTSVDGGQADGLGPDGKGASKKWGCHAIRQCVRKMKLNKGQFMNLGKGWPFPDGTLGRPVNTWISIWAAKDKFTAPLIKPVRAGAGGATVTEGGDHSLYYLRIEMDPKTIHDLDEKFVLTSTDGSFELTRTAKDDLIEGDNFIDLEFSGLPMNLSYSMKIIPSSGDPYFLYQNVPFDKLNGYMP
jgi:hypothetical protein